MGITASETEQLKDLLRKAHEGQADIDSLVHNVRREEEERILALIPPEVLAYMRKKEYKLFPGVPGGKHFFRRE